MIVLVHYLLQHCTCTTYIYLYVNFQYSDGYIGYSQVITNRCVFCLQLTKSTSNLNDVVYSGRPKNEEPHVKRTTKKKAEKIEYIVRVDLVRLSKKIMIYSQLLYKCITTSICISTILMFNVIQSVLGTLDTVGGKSQLLLYPKIFIPISGTT